MASTRYKKILFIRFLIYFMILLGGLALVSEFGPLAQAEFQFRKDKVLNVKHSLPPQVVTSSQGNDDQPGSQVRPSSGTSVGFEDLPGSNEQLIKPVSTDYGVVIEKINANAKVIADVDPSNQAQYIKALSQGVAEAQGSTKPGQPGNLYLFSHSTDAPWNVARYNAIFYLLRELSIGDRVSVFYQDRRYDYIVYDEQVVPGNDVSFLTNRYDKPVLTLQTCDPPGTTLNRLIVRAKLQGS